MAKKKGKTTAAEAPPSKPAKSSPPSSMRNGMVVSAAVLLAAIAVAGVLQLWKQGAGGEERLPVVSPLDAPRMKDLEQFDAEYKHRMLWGTYRPGMYMGARMRVPQSLLTGLMWMDPEDPRALSSIRHECREGDGMKRYGWLRHDGTSFGQQEILDAQQGYNLSVTWVKETEGEVGPGGDWAMRVEASQLPGQRPAGDGDRGIALLWYMADERGPLQPGLNWRIHSKGPVLQDSEPAPLLQGSHSSTGDWAVHALPSRPVRLSHFVAPIIHFHNLTDAVRYTLYKHVMSQMKKSKELGLDNAPVELQLPSRVIQAPGVASNTGFFLFTGRLPFSLDIVFTSGLPAPDAPAGAVPKNPITTASVVQRVLSHTGSALDGVIEDRERRFDERFDKTFGTADDIHPEEVGSDDGKQTRKVDADAIRRVSKAALSNLIGGIGYFYGSSRVGVPLQVASGDEAVYEEELILNYFPAPLFTAVPSRPFFPRGFLWDEGFHQMLLQRWDPKLSRDVLAHWLDLMNADGWIPREQILGEEARARVPAEFVVQRPSIANPPSLMLPIMRLAQQLFEARKRPPAADAPAPAERAAGGAAANATGAAEAPRAQRNLLAEDPDEFFEAAEFLQASWPRLRAWVSWLNSTQAGPLPGSFRWRGRDAAATAELNPKTLPSGLDDYPRSSHPTDDERHLDLRCWIAFCAQAMAVIGAAAEADPEEALDFAVAAVQLSQLDLLNQHHLDTHSGQFRDWGLHTEHVLLDQESGSRIVELPPELRFVPQFGYVSLFPLAMGLLPSSSRELERQLDLLSQPDLLWSRFGLRSLALNASLYRAWNTAHDRPYWRAPVWLNINFLILRSLKQYGALEDNDNPSDAQRQNAAAASSLYRQLRARLLHNVVHQYETSGFLWENYDDKTGKGMGSHPFTGWTSLVVLIAAEAL